MAQRCIRTDTGRWVETDDGLLPLPGSHHPATADFADSVRTAAVLHVDVPIYSSDNRSLVGGGEFDAVITEATFSRREAYHVDTWGAWVWRIWEGPNGWRIASHDMEWIPQPWYMGSKPEFARAPFVHAPKPKAAAR